MKEFVSFSLPSSPPSMNSAYNVLFAQRRVEMKPEVRRYKTLMKPYVKALEVKDDEVVWMRVSVAQDWNYKNGKLKKQDVANMLKVLIDLIAEKQGWDDARLWALEVKKEQNQEKDSVAVEMGKWKV
jgi:Holliday junction resolvase RusA-like endonuclease